MFSSYFNRIILSAKGSKRFILLILLAAIIVPVIEGSSPREGYDAKTGKWINRRPSAYAFSISYTTYQNVKNWYATDSGTNNPNNLPLEAPKEGYTYIYTPYHDPLHPESVGMSVGGLEGYKGYWYADDLTKATDSVTSTGADIQIPPPVDNSPKELVLGGYDARTGNWVHNNPGVDAFTVSSGTYTRIKNWFTTNFGADNPLNLPLQVPKDGFTYIYVPFNDPKHPGVVGMSFQGSSASKGYWYADKIGVTNDTIVTKPAIQNAPPVNITPPTQKEPPH